MKCEEVTEATGRDGRTSKEQWFKPFQSDSRFERVEIISFKDRMTPSPQSAMVLLMPTRGSARAVPCEEAGAPVCFCKGRSAQNVDRKVKLRDVMIQWPNCTPSAAPSALAAISLPLK